MGTRKISGVVLKRNRDYMKILRDGRIDGGYDLLATTGAASNLTDGDRFTLYITAVSLRESKGIEVYTFANATLKKDNSRKYTLEFDSEETSILLYVFKKFLESIIIQSADSNEKDYSIAKQYKHVKKMQGKLQGVIIKGVEL